ncbi:MAG: FHA domain-containing protein [Planctomycetota bacterium]
MNVSVVLLKKNGTHRSFPLPSSVTVIGRRQDCELCVPLMTISRRHCEINHDQGSLKLRDLNSRNGTYVNGKRVEESEVKAGDYIQLGPVIFALQIDGVPADIKAPDPSMRPPKEEVQPDEKPSIGQSGTFAGMGDLSASQSQEISDLLDALDDADLEGKGT